MRILFRELLKTHKIWCTKIICRIAISKRGNKHMVLISKVEVLFIYSYDSNIKQIETLLTGIALTKNFHSIAQGKLLRGLNHK